MRLIEIKFFLAMAQKDLVNLPLSGFENLFCGYLHTGKFTCTFDSHLTVLTS